MFIGLIQAKSNIVSMKLINLIRKIIRQSNIFRLKNNNFTLITNNCIGGIICHDLHQKFNSPTVNLDFDDDDFILFCKHLDAFLSSQIEQVSTQEKFPVRINWNNIYVVMEGGFASEQNIRDFDELPFENKVIFLRDGYYSKNSITIPRRFYDMSFHHGKLLEYTGRNLRRNFEILDYVNFINGRGIKMTKLFKPVL